MQKKRQNKRRRIMSTTTIAAAGAPRRRWAHTRTTSAAVWLISAAAIFSLHRLSLSSSSSKPNPISQSSISHRQWRFASSESSNRRSKLYDSMAVDLDRRGASFLGVAAETSQSLSLSDIFALTNGSVSPILKVSNPAVRANVLYLSTEFSVPISEAVKLVFGPKFEQSIWFQNPSMYHFSMFHASHHIMPVLADELEIEAEASSVGAVSMEMCPLSIVLDRVVLTSTGVLLGCWQVVSGTDPISIRSRLKAALPRAPEKQLYDAAILHTSFARLLGPPKTEAKEMNSSEVIQIFHELVARLNKELTGFKAVVSELWYIEEYDLLALALNGRMKIRKFQLGCSSN